MGGAVECFDVGPLEAGDVDGELLVSGGKFGMMGKPGRKPGAEIAKRKRGGGIVLEVGKDQGVEAAGAEDGVEGGIVLLRLRRSDETSIDGYRFRGARKRRADGWA